MTRTTKKTVYGAVYFGALVFILFFLFGPDIRSRSTCQDGIRNQRETSIDCGGPCEPCEKSVARSLVISAAPRQFWLLDEARVIFGVRNPNTRLRAVFSYEVYVSGSEIGVQRGLGFVRALEEKMVYVPYLPKEFSAEGQVDVRIKDVKFELDDAAARPSVSVAVRPITEVSGTDRYVRVKLANEGVVNAEKVEVIAVLQNRYSTPLFPGFTQVDDLSAYESREATVIFPPGLDVAAVASDTTRIYLSAQ